MEKLNPFVLLPWLDLHYPYGVDFFILPANMWHLMLININIYLIAKCLLSLLASWVVNIATQKSQFICQDVVSLLAQNVGCWTYIIYGPII